MKPVVKCKVVRSLPVVGESAFVFPENHPNHVFGQGVSNTCVAITSTILSVDEESRRFETQNTIYQWDEIIKDIE